jgi:hypothetical protein
LLFFSVSGVSRIKKKKEREKACDDM